MDPANGIRILDLLAGADGDDIQCTIRNTELGTAESYEALSYVWGDHVNLTPIVVSGTTVQITQSLYSALRRLRDKNSTRSLWIDQLCINQSDPQEKARQVNMMRRIYRSCSRCLIWLGEVPDAISVDDASGALDFIRFCAGHLGDDVPPSLSTHEQLIGARTAFRALGLNGNAWWSRIWTVQEAVLPPEALVVWGELQIPWSAITDAATFICFSAAQALPKRILHVFMNIIDEFTAPVRGLEIARHGESPLDMLQRWRYRGSADPRDKVFALMGLFSSMPLPSIQSCDYGMSMAVLYSRVTIDLIHLEGGLRPLVGQRPSVDPNLPTWAISLDRVPNPKTEQWWWNHSHRYGWFTASRGMLPLQCVPLHDGTVLSLSGHFVDTIRQFGKPLPAEISENVSKEQVKETLRSWKRIMDQSKRYRNIAQNYPNGDLPAVAFWRTMLGDLIMAEFPKRRANTDDGRLVSKFCQAETVPNDVYMYDIYMSMVDFLVGQTFFITEGGYIGIGPQSIAEGDEVWVLSGGNVPFILRPKSLAGDQSAHSKPDGAPVLTLEGNAFVYGLMDGEAFGIGPNSQSTVHLH